MTHKFAKVFDVRHQNKDFQVLFLKAFDDDDEKYQIQMTTYFLGNSLNLNIGVETEAGRDAIFEQLNFGSAVGLLKQFEEMGIDFTEDEYE